MTNIDHLLAPISEEEPSGSYLKLDRSAYRSLRNVYNTAQSSFRQLVETPDASSDLVLVETNSQNWTELKQISEETLASKSKDLEILGWYLTSQLFTSNPFENLAAAIPTLNLFIEKFWNTLNPMPPENKIKASDEAGIAREVAEFRTKPLLQLVGESVDSTSIYVPFQMLSFCGDITFGDYLLAERKGNMAELKENAAKDFDQSTKDTLEHLVSIHSELEIAEKNLASKCQAVGATVISFSYIKTNVKDLINAIHFLVGDKFAPWPVDENFHLIDLSAQSAPASVEQPAAQSFDASNVQSTVPASSAATEQTATVGQVATEAQTIVHAVSSINGIVNRDHAFQEIRKIADYFKETEPHSPIAFLLERSIRWGYMSFPELLQEMIGAESNVIAQINQMTGMDKLDQTDLSGKSIPTTLAAGAQPAVAPTIEEPAAPTPVPDSSNSTTETPQTSEPTSTSSSSSLQDFEW
ncbi:ImpA family type VI secretion system protein [Vibrio profundi]|uniref:type VI secretion system protein TssA n=1 Tax=Vibrio profundi TaxID=1774960 RepID=UPI003736DA66